MKLALHVHNSIRMQLMPKVRTKVLQSVLTMHLCRPTGKEAVCQMRRGVLVGLFQEFDSISLSIEWSEEITKKSKCSTSKS